MGLTSDFSKYGVTFEGAYHRITALNYRVHESETPVMVVTGSTDADGNLIPPVYETQWTKAAYASGDIDTYATQDARNAHSESLNRSHFSFEVDLDSTDTWIEQAYTHVKTLSAFEGSVDVL